jgi:hypothetical protein
MLARHDADDNSSGVSDALTWLSIHGRPAAVYAAS